MADNDADDVAALLPLTPAVFHILVVLARGQAHGYAIMAEVSRLTGGAIQIGPGTLYRSIYGMLQGGLIEEVARSEDERRNTYRVSHRGLLVARAEARRLERLVGVARESGLLEGRGRPRRRPAP